MIDIEKELRHALVSMGGVQGMVLDRVWADWFRSKTVPAVMFEIDHENRDNDLEGRGGLVVAEANVICRANTKAEARRLAEAVRANGTDPGTGLAGYTGTFDAVLDDIQLAAVPKGDGSNAHWYDANMSFTLLWKELR